MKKSNIIIICSIIVALVLIFVVVSIVSTNNNKPTVETKMDKESDSSGFVLLSEAVPDAILEIRYYSTYNFVGDRIDGYEEPCALLTKEAASALKEVSDELVAKGYRLKIYDAYRPQKAVTHFMNWAKNVNDCPIRPSVNVAANIPSGSVFVRCCNRLSARAI